MLVQQAELPGAERATLQFETLTLAPIDRKLVDVTMLTQAERHWLDAYHARVYATLADRLDPVERDWLGHLALSLSLSLCYLNFWTQCQRQSLDLRIQAKLPTGHLSLSQHLV